MRARLIAAAAMLVAALAAAGCASFDGYTLVPGKSTGAEVEALMGVPSQRLTRTDGDTALYFSRLPEGRAMFVVIIGPDGIMKSIEQRLERSNLKFISVGTSTKKEVQDLLGPPGRTGMLALQPLEWWEYKYFDYYERRILWVEFSGDGVVREVIDSLDWEYVRGGRRGKR